MAGLLDGYGIDPMAMGLLGAGGALLTPRQQGGGIGAALQAFPQGMMQGREMQRRAQAQALQQQMLQQRMEMDQKRFGMDEKKFAAEQEQYTAQQGLTKQKMERIQQVRAQIALEKPELLPMFDIDPMKAMERMFPDPVKPTIVPKGGTVLGPDNKPVFTNQEAPERTSMEKALAAAGIDPKSPEGLSMLRAYAVKTATHAPAANQTVHTGTMVQAEGPDGRPVFVMPTKEGTVTSVPGLAPPGTKKDADAAANRVKAETDRARLMIGTVDDALKKVGFTTTGALGATLGKMPGTSAYDLRATVETLKANLGFQQLAEMRAASPTGGALGAIAVQELNALQSTLASVDANQSQDQLAGKLKQIRTHYNKWLNTVQFGGGGTPQNAGGDDPLGLRPKR